MTTMTTRTKATEALLSRKHYKIISDIFSEEIHKAKTGGFSQGNREASVESICSVGEELARYFQKVDKRFKPLTFLAVSGCGKHIPRGF